ncbi:uncharacterized protein K444DRAFT_388799 [Hyaloscypha bicolor E]|jgi:peroxiredoxin 5|uniref:Redoxin domain-containing protein n=1 Tax=Hyaloscypha bicolor E TaxID=1095630 RepID=A0A2J6TCN3_9HELO|nr:uncharacterized protein K444DRAFT_388799 [Hyaloscypha bicolor E]PMD60779.1 hypothetical protein K444DRAFT_388799 [Hyaloscypha bicolor E]
MNAWSKSIDGDSSGIRFFGAYQERAFTRALDLEFEAAPLLGTNRSRRYAIVVENGKVNSVDVEPDDIIVSVSTAGKVLGWMRERDKGMEIVVFIEL